jgi:uncharacterized protein (DUF779 family)
METRCVFFQVGAECLNIVYISVAQPFYTRGTLNLVEESWRHTNPILQIVGGGGGVGL